MKEALALMRVAGAMACAAGRSRNDCPYHPIYFPEPYFVWCEGWDEANEALKMEPVGG